MTRGFLKSNIEERKKNNQINVRGALDCLMFFAAGRHIMLSQAGVSTVSFFAAFSEP